MIVDTNREIVVGDTVYIVTKEYDHKNQKDDYLIDQGKITEITKKFLIVDFKNYLDFDKFYFYLKKDLYEFALPAATDGSHTVLCFKENDAKKHILKQQLMEEIAKQPLNERTCTLEQLLLMKAGFTVKRNQKDMERELSGDAHPINFASFITVAGGSTKVVVYHGDTENMEILWQGSVDDIPFPKVPYGDWIVEHHTVVNDEDILKVFLKEPGDHFDRTWSNIKITNIKWDTSEDTKVWAKLPDEVDVLDMDIDLSKYDPSKDLDYDDEFLDDVSEWLTSHYDFCHDGFNVVTK